MAVDLKYWSNFTVLLAEGESDLKIALENVSRSVLLGDYEAAEHAFQQPPLAASKSVAVTLQKANMLDRMGHETERAKLLRESYEDYAKLEPRDQINEADVILSECLSAEICALGLYRPAFETLECLVQRLAIKTLDFYNLIEIYCAIGCHRVLKMCNREANWADAEGDKPSINDTLPSMTSLRHRAQLQGQYELAMSIVKSESAWSPSGMALEPYQEIFDPFPKTTADICACSDMTVYKAMITKIFFAEVIAENGYLSQAQNQLEEVMNVKTRLCSTGVFLVDELERLQLLHDRAKLLMDPSQNPDDQLSSHQNIVDRAAARSERPIERVHRRTMVDIVQELYETANPSDRRFTLQKLQRMLQDYLSFETERPTALFQLSAITHYGLYTSTLRTQRYDVFLAMILQFCIDFPDYSGPKTGSNMANSGRICAHALGNEELAITFQELYEEFDQQNEQWRKVANGKLELKYEDDDHFYLEWRRTSGNDYHESGINTCCRLILKWIKIGWRNGTILPAVITSVLKGSQDAVKDGTTTLTEESFPNDMDFRRLVFGRDKPVPDSLWDVWFETVEQWLRQDFQGPSATQRHAVLVKLLQYRAHLLDQYSGTLHSASLAKAQAVVIRAHRKHLETINSLGDSVISQIDQNSAKFGLANSITVLSNLSINSVAKEYGQLTDNLIIEAMDILEDLEVQHKAQGNLWKLYMTLRTLALLTLRRWEQFDVAVPGPEESLPIFGRAEGAYNKLRLDTTMVSRSIMVSTKTRQTDQSNPQIMYLEVIRAALATWSRYINSATNKAKFDDPNNTDEDFWRLTNQLVDWIQRSKARTMVDMLGLDVTLPASVVEFLTTDKAVAAELMRKEEELVDQFNKATPIGRIRLREDLDSIKVQLRQVNASLEHVIAMREGSPISLRELEDFGRELGPDVVLIDWVISYRTPFSCFMIVYRNGRFRNIRPISNITFSDVQSWIKDYLHEEEPLKHPGAIRDLAYLAPFVEPLLDTTLPGETLIFCPTNELHQIPLHAIKVGSMGPMIERNPIVYIQSLSLLRLCRLSQSTRKGTQESTHAVVFNTLSELDNGANTTGPIRDIINAVPLTNEEVTKENFAIYGSMCHVIHLHGHVSFSETDTKDHHIIFKNPPETPDDTLSYNEIFDMQLTRPCLVVAMGCNSGRAHFTGADDLLGLPAAFHCAGASAVVSTLWPVHREDCLRFSEAFYQDFVDQMPYNVEEVSLIQKQNTAESVAESEQDHTQEVGHLPAAGLKRTTMSTDTTTRLSQQVEQIGIEEGTTPVAQDQYSGDLQMEVKPEQTPENEEPPEYRPDTAYPTTGSQPVINLALALQTATLSLAKNEEGYFRSPYHWAGFMLHGDWKFYCTARTTGTEEPNETNDTEEPNKTEETNERAETTGAEATNKAKSTETAEAIKGIENTPSQAEDIMPEYVGPTQLETETRRERKWR